MLLNYSLYPFTVPVSVSFVSVTDNQYLKKKKFILAYSSKVSVHDSLAVSLRATAKQHLSVELCGGTKSCHLMTKEQREEGEGADVPLPPSQAHLQ
jgi:hypothetical protein